MHLNAEYTDRVNFKSVSNWFMKSILLNALKAPDKSIAMRSGNQSGCSYGSLRKLVSGMIECLQASGFVSGHRVLTIMEDSPATAIAQFALCDYLTAMPVNPALMRRKLSEIANSSRVDAVMFDAGNSVAREIAIAAGKTCIVVTPIDKGHCGEFSLSIENGHALRIPDNIQTDIGLVLPTSGSTGDPKQVPLSRSALLNSARNIAETLNLDANDVVVNMLPMFHIGAIVDLFLSPLVADGTINFAHPVSSENLKQALLNETCTWMQAVPTMLINLIAICSEDELRQIGEKLRFVRSVSSDLSAELHTDFEHRLNGTPIISMYGMTETAGQISSNPLPPKVRKFGSVGLVNGPEILITDDFGNGIRAGLEGEICVRGPTVTKGYEGCENGQYFYGDWLRTGDLGRIDNDGYLTLTGRLKDIINRGGEKISPQEIDKVILTHSAVQEAMAFGVKHDTLGEEVAAAVTLKSGHTTSIDDLRKYLRSHLAAHTCPRQLWIFEEMPKLASGKIDRNGLKRLALEPSSLSGIVEQSTTALGQKLAKIWRETLGQSQADLDADFFDLGGDSLSATTFLLEIEKQTRISTPADLLYEAPTLRQLEIALNAVVPLNYDGPLPIKVFNAVKTAIASWGGQRDNSNSLIVGHNSVGQCSPFFWCCSGIDQWRPLVNEAGTNQPIYVMRSLSGLQQKSDKNNQNLARHYANEICTLQPKGELRLGGFCQGAVVTRLVCDQLRTRGRIIKLHVVVDRIFGSSHDVPTAYFWSRSSHHSAQVVFDQPEIALPRMHPAGSVGVRTDFPHHKITGISGMKAILPKLAMLLENGVEPSKYSDDDAPVLTALLRAKIPLLASPGDRLTVPVTVQNVGKSHWTPGDTQRLVVAGRWLNLDFHPRVFMDGSVELSKPIAPGDTVKLSLKLTFPDRCLPMILIIDIVDDGVAWFHQTDGKPFRRLIWPNKLRITKPQN